MGTQSQAELIQNFKFREFLLASKFQNVFNFDEQLSKKIKILYRVSYLKECIFSSISDNNPHKASTMLYQTYQQQVIEAVLTQPQVCTLF